MKGKEREDNQYKHPEEGRVCSFQDGGDLCLNADEKEPIEKSILLMFKSRGFFYCLKCMRRQKYLRRGT